MAWRPSPRLAHRVLTASAIVLAAMSLGTTHVHGEVPPRLDLNAKLVVGSALLALGVPLTPAVGVPVSPAPECERPTPLRSISAPKAKTEGSLQPSSSSALKRWTCNACLAPSPAGVSQSGTCFEEELVRTCYFLFFCVWSWEPTGRTKSISCSGGVVIQPWL